MTLSFCPSVYFPSILRLASLPVTEGWTSGLPGVTEIDQIGGACGRSGSPPAQPRRAPAGLVVTQNVLYLSVSVPCSSQLPEVSVLLDALPFSPPLLKQGSVSFIIEFFSNYLNVTVPCAFCGDPDKHTGRGTEMYETKINVYCTHHKGVIAATLAVAAISYLQCASYFVKHIPRINPLILIMTQRRFQFY